MKCLQQFEAIKISTRSLAKITSADTTRVLLKLADEAEKNIEILLAENQKDLVRMEKSNPKYDRLLLTADRIKSIAGEIRNVASLTAPVGEILEEKVLPNGLKMSRKRVPLGVVGVIYEARPNVTFDVFALCFRSGNAVVLKGSSDAEFSNIAIAKLIKQVLVNEGVDSNIVQLLPPDRYAADELMNAVGYVDVLIPRGSQSLINSVRDNSKVPVIETGAGIVHTYFDKTGDLESGANIIFNAKTRRVSVCNALDCLIIHKDRISDLPKLVEKMASKSVVLFADELAYKSLNGKYDSSLLQKADKESFGTEFLDYKMAIKTVSSLDEALDHIYNFSSKHSEAIISADNEAIERFLNEVDAAAVYANTSTAYTDGAQFGLGAEIGISTQKLHARGPMALRELTSYKWIVRGDGQVRA
jgi:glutamate-5-semialdehyde dehydrogenase